MADRIKKAKERETSFDMQKTKEVTVTPYSEEELIALKAYSPLSDVEKNIDEAERYIDAMLNGQIEIKRKPEPPYPLEPEPDLKSTEEISRFEPKDIHLEEIPKHTDIHTEVFTVGEKFEMPETDNVKTEIFDLAVDAETIETVLHSEKTDAQTDETVDLSDLQKEFHKKEKEDKTREEQYQGIEYTDEEQRYDILATLRSRYLLSKIRLAVALVLAAMLFAVENIGAVRELFPSQTAYVVTDWVLALACSLLIFDRIGMALKTFFRFHADVDTVTLWSLIFSVAATAVALLFETSESTVSLYNFPYAVCVFLNALAVFYTLRRDILSFKVLSSSHSKLAVELHDADEELPVETVEFSETLSQKGKTYGTIRSADFIDDYFQHKSEESSVRRPLSWFLPACLLIAVLLFFGAYFLEKHNVAESIAVAYAAFMMCTPFSVFVAYCYPSYLASRRAYSYRSAVLCDKTPENYRDIALVAFDDTDAFPANKAKVRGVRLYADRKIDHAIHYAHLAYAEIGGPLASVFARADCHSEKTEEVRLREVAKDGICVLIDEKNIVIGTPEYMEEQCFETHFERGDEEYLGNSLKRIFYLACDQIVIAKFYIQYVPDTDFMDMARDLCAAGISVSVRTADPCLDDGVFYHGKNNLDRYSVRIVKGFQTEDDERKCVSAGSAGVISLGSIKDLMYSMLLCKRIENVRRTNLILQAVACGLGVAVMALVLFTGNAPVMLSIYPTLYQFFWLLPIYFVSKIYI
ncbi:MAG: hypothetical protein IJ489_05070 [Clostridia bacterium]|nr:hypothetical protein [Clostridia bacterium]